MYRKERKMKTDRSYRRRGMAALIIMTAMILALIPASAAAASGTVKMTVYDDVLKSGNTVYCAGRNGIYKVKLKKGKAVNVKRLVEKEDSYFWIMGMKKKGNYIYYITGGSAPYGPVCRVNIKNGRIQRITKNLYEPDYVIKKNKLYYSKSYDDDGNRKTYAAKLNGKSPKRTSVMISSISKRSNAKGYSLKTVSKGNKTIDYLKTPKGKYYLGEWTDSY